MDRITGCTGPQLSSYLDRSPATSRGRQWPKTYAADTNYPVNPVILSTGFSIP